MRRRRSLLTAAAMAVVLLIGVAVLVSRAAAGREDQPTRFGVLAQARLAAVKPGREVCQAPIDVDRQVPELGLAVDTERSPGPALAVTVRDPQTRRVIRSARLAGGYRIPLSGYVTVPLDRPIPADTSVAVCARNVGRRDLPIVGELGLTASYSQARIGADVVEGDWAVFLLAAGEQRRSQLQMVPDIVRRAAVLRPGIVTPALYVLLAALIFLGGPVALWWAVRSAASDDDEDEGRPGRRGA